MGCCESTPARCSQPQEGQIQQSRLEEGQIPEPKGVVEAHWEITKYSFCKSSFPHCRSRLATMVRQRARRGSRGADYDENSALYDSDIPLTIRQKVASLEADELRRLGDGQWALRNLLARHLWKQEQARNAVELKVAEANGQILRYPIPLPLPPIPLTASSSSSQEVTDTSNKTRACPSALTSDVTKHGPANVKAVKAPTHQASSCYECRIVEKQMEEAAAPKPTSNMKDTSATARGGGIGPIIYVENLPLNISASRLEKEFKRFGNIKPGQIQLTNKGPSGSAFIVFESRDSVAKAIQGSPLLIFNKLVFVRV